MLVIRSVEYFESARSGDWIRRKHHSGRRDQQFRDRLSTLDSDFWEELHSQYILSKS